LSAYFFLYQENTIANVVAAAKPVIESFQNGLDEPNPTVGSTKETSKRYAIVKTGTKTRMDFICILYKTAIINSYALAPTTPLPTNCNLQIVLIGKLKEL
jgi:hypothetical protein